MTTADDLKAALSAWVDETETNILGLKSGLGSVDATVSALQTELASEQADVANIKTDIDSLKASVAALTPVPVEPPPPPPPPPPTSASVDPATVTVEIWMNGETAPIVFDGKNAVDQGIYSGQFVKQRSYRIDLDNSPLTVHIRPDVDSDRLEVVFELGRMWGVANDAAANSQPYTATIKVAGNVVATIQVASHWWFSRWRWQSAPRKTVRTPKDLADAKLALPYAAGLNPTDPKVPGVLAQASYSIMGNAGVTMAEGGTGDRPDIGLVTELQGYYLATGRDDALAGVMAQAEASGSIPYHMRDETTGCVPDLSKHPQLQWYYTKGGVDWVKAQGWMKNYGTGTLDKACPWATDEGHSPALSYIPYLLTDDPYFLEELQFMAMQALCWTGWDRNVAKLQIPSPGQTRTFAWSLRSIFEAAKVSPNAPPAWLKDSGYFKNILGDCLTFFNHFVKSPLASRQNFRNATMFCNGATWQEDMLATVLQFAVYLGFSEWQEAADWKLGSTVARSNGTSGWPKMCASPYHMQTHRTINTTQGYTAAIDESQVCADWAEAWNVSAARPDNATYLKGFDPNQSKTQDNYDYHLYVREVLAIAKLNGNNAEAAACFGDIAAQGAARNYMDWKRSIAA